MPVRSRTMPDQHPLPTHTEPRVTFAPASAVVPATDEAPIRALEHELAAYLELPAAHVVAVQSHAEAYRALLEAGRAALGDAGKEYEVIVPALLGNAAAAATRALGLTAVPAEVDAATATLSAHGLVSALGDRPAVAVTTHAFGHPAPLDEFVRATRDRPVVFVEDASEALGAALRDVPAGRMAEAAIIAFASGRLLSGGTSADNTGALLILRDPDLAAHARETCTPLGESTARIALAELRSIEAELQARRELAWELTLNLRGIRGIAPMPHGRWIRHGYPRYVVRLRSLLWRRSLDETLEALRAAGVPCERACGPSLHLDEAMGATADADSRFNDDHFAAATALPGELIAIPLHRDLTSRDMADLAQILRHLEERST